MTKTMIKINIAEILRCVKIGTKLYSPFLGEVILNSVCFDNEKPIKVLDVDGDSWEFDQYGRLSERGECMLFPNKNNWNWLRDGDIICVEEEWSEDEILIFKEQNKEKLYCYAMTWGRDKVILYNYTIISNVIIRKATDLEKQKLFDALGKKGKTWDVERKKIVDLPNHHTKLCELHPFDKVLVRRSYGEMWTISFFSHMGRRLSEYVCLTGRYEQCIPYNDSTKHLLGTADEWKGGEK